MSKETNRSAETAPTAPADFTLRSLRMFVAVEEAGSIGGAADRLNVSSSGVSQQITALEEAVGTKLFDRVNRPITLTPAGQVLRTHARKILQSVSDAVSELAELDLATLPRLSLAIIDDLDASLTPILVASLRKQFRNCFVNATSGRSDRVTGSLQRRDADLAVSAVLPDDVEQFQTVQISREAFILVAARGVIEPGTDLLPQLKTAPFIQYSEELPIGRLLAQHLRRVRFEPDRFYAFEASRSVLAMAVQERGWAITTPLNLLDAERFLPDLDILPLPFPALSRRIWLIARDGELGGLPARLADECRTLIAARILPRFASAAPRLRNALEVVYD